MRSVIIGELGPSLRSPTWRRVLRAASFSKKDYLIPPIQDNREKERAKRVENVKLSIEKN
jgi:hypothetical protein